jgi:hypothetical protein
VLLSVGADIWFSPRAESGDELRPFGHNRKDVSANAYLFVPSGQVELKNHGRMKTNGQIEG